ncbi:hypothetical protein ACIQGW_12635 [Lysinibacillus xylanilyticus]|uniref:hypothetical protein n=1 Tax=Lysinibacillus xylanilyticus TaxID=582475 RepID=UPI0038171D9C
MTLGYKPIKLRRIRKSQKLAGSMAETKCLTKDLLVEIVIACLTSRCEFALEESILIKRSFENGFFLIEL